MRMPVYRLKESANRKRMLVVPAGPRFINGVRFRRPPGMGCRAQMEQFLWQNNTYSTKRRKEKKKELKERKGKMDARVDKFRSRRAGN